MTSPAAIAERHSEMLSQFAEMAFELAKDIQARALAADDAETAGKLAKDFHHVGRSLRQALALHARLQREHLGIVEAHDAKAAQVREIKLIRRKTEVGKAAEAMVWNEYEDEEEADFILSLLPAAVEYAAEAEDFLDAPVEVLVARIRQGLIEDFAEEPGPAAPPPEPQSSA